MKQLFFTLLLFLSISTQAQDFSGSYSYRDDAIDVTLTLEKNARGKYSGTMTANEESYQIAGKVNQNVLSGTVGDELDAIAFEARLSKDRLSFIMVEVDENGNPIPQTAQTFVFQRISSPKASSKKVETKSADRIVINDITLTTKQIDELARTYGKKPLPGNYWYDSMSGLYGVACYPSYGFMLPGHEFGTMKRDASQGNTKAFINGRELPMAEYIVWSYMVGAWIKPGRYWLDAQGNAGYESNSVPVINLYQLAQQNSYNGRGGSGDNFWSTRFSAGNYDSDNTRGYVSVPGYGPVGYGF